MANTQPDLYAWLRTQFTDLPSAKLWYAKWRDVDDQTLPPEFQDSPADGFSLRAMAAHVSYALEGYADEPTGNGVCTNYMSTKYGSDIICSRPYHQLLAEPGRAN